MTALMAGQPVPILRSQQQGDILALLLGDPDLELSLTEIAQRTGAPHPSVHREVVRAEQAGLVTTRKVGNTRLVRANTDSPYYAGLADVLTRAFGVPAVLADVLRRVPGVGAAMRAVGVSACRQPNGVICAPVGTAALCFGRPFAHGMPPHGGFAIGLERWTSRLTQSANIRDVTLFAQGPPPPDPMTTVTGSPGPAGRRQLTLTAPSGEDLELTPEA